MSLQLVGVDLETGGLNGYETLPSGERVHGAAYYPILEMAFVVCDENLNKEFSFSVGIWNESFLERMDPWALEAHTKSGLIDQLRNQSGEHLGVFSDVEDAELFAIETLMHFGVSIYDRKAKTGAVMFGNSIGFDVSYIDAQMPSLKGFFHYRTIDVSSIDLLRQTAWAGLGLPKSEKQYAHTAMSDIQETLGELVGYTLHLERPAANVLMSRDNPNGWKLEELLPKVAKEIAVKTERIKGDESGRSLSIQKNNTEIETFLYKAARKQFDTLRLLDEVGPDQGPEGEARI
ncbi:exonuclease domain-containing protein [Marinomonas ostreistagni]|uniref:Uncharacterized protein n=1 Tax=Marinomonas ostreistagni TaxID=359209 RepID=A0ABS0ZAS7_9GAMM|nr:exonuclease domain-containing protein [Marinomonas ostreistagni]MBJ7550764.1 hypothetical protein [Marinomonas ostreistagni]